MQTIAIDFEFIVLGIRSLDVHAIRIIKEINNQFQRTAKAEVYSLSSVMRPPTHLPPYRLHHRTDPNLGACRIVMVKFSSRGRLTDNNAMSDAVGKILWKVLRD